MGYTVNHVFFPQESITAVDNAHVFATDLHGSERTFRKFINAAKFYHVQILIMGGDVLGKLAVPIIREPSGNFRATLHGRVQRLTTAAELAAFQDLIGVLGFYFKIMDEDEFLAVRADPASRGAHVSTAGAGTPAVLDRACRNTVGRDRYHVLHHRRQ